MLESREGAWRGVSSYGVGRLVYLQVDLLC